MSRWRGDVGGSVVPGQADDVVGEGCVVFSEFHGVWIRWGFRDASCGRLVGSLWVGVVLGGLLWGWFFGWFRCGW